MLKYSISIDQPHLITFNIFINLCLWFRVKHQWPRNILEMNITFLKPMPNKRSNTWSQFSYILRTTYFVPKYDLPICKFVFTGKCGIQKKNYNLRVLKRLGFTPPFVRRARYFRANLSKDCYAPSRVLQDWKQRRTCFMTRVKPGDNSKTR
jgi:hypothetical protein